MIDIVTRSKAPNEVKALENENKNRQRFLEVTPVQKESLTKTARPCK